MDRFGALRRAALGLALVLVVAACGSSGSDGSSSSSTTKAATATALTGTRWLLSSTTNLGVPTAGTSVTAQFQDGQVSGDSGCNTYRASYQTSGSKLTIGRNIAGTQIACPPGPTAVDQAYLARLPSVASYAIKGTTLTLANAGGTAILVYEASDGASAIKGKWTVTSFYTGNALESPVTGSTLTADFAADQVSGDSGCNTFSGPYDATATTIKIGPLASTLRACADPAVATQEQKYLAALQLAATYAVTGDRLDLLRADGGFAATFEKSSG